MASAPPASILSTATSPLMIAVVGVLAAARQRCASTSSPRSASVSSPICGTMCSLISPRCRPPSSTAHAPAKWCRGLTADTTQIKSTVGASRLRRAAQFRAVPSLPAMMVVTSPRLSCFVLFAIPVIVLPLVAFGRRVRAAVARRTGYAGGCVGLAVRDDRRGAHAPGFHQ